MNDPDEPTQHDDTRESGEGSGGSRAGSRAELLPEEQRAGSDDPEAQAAAILADSDERTEDPAGTRDASVQTPGLTDGPRAG